MYAPLVRLIDQASTLTPSDSILAWASPVPFFGDADRATVATVGINPSNREFVDATGHELCGSVRRLSTLTSLGLARWSQVTGQHLSEIRRSCLRYFQSNPYRRWFDVLDRTLRAGEFSYYDGSACHLDLVALATRDKWSAVDPQTREKLIADGKSVLAQIIRDSSLTALILNGRSVVSEFESFADVQLSAERVEGWTLPRTSGGVDGYMFTGTVDTLGGVDLGRQVRVYGYNHNLQSSFGVTSQVIDRIGVRLGEFVAAPCR
ncbi:hypothetical protein [Mycobacteroides abscessus]|uniref:hypothetical protein n=1 Tax=Mycobacteroides abscessus TaxID=36809 RepID=UPI0005B4B2F7|nr:hypothetical protein [Mycobacteroides abscessus]MDO2969901.1 hypothetical protein [Mycobacteroides abscessus subsp. bolletii]MDO3079903.1 hypothetical protein [Mycobacteroides abscessus subsp. bolletii]SKK68314.1 Uncharacterised protein [Mycobacteroides abscessus subsp. bolletii]